MGTLRAVQVGVGPIGQEILASAQGHDVLRFVGAVDLDPDLVGTEVGPPDAGITVTDRLPSRGEADVAVTATSSTAAGMLRVVEACAEAGLHIASTCEQLSYPWVRHPDEARRVDEIEREAGVVVIGGGINPGYLMDVLPAFLRWPMTALRSVRVRRAVNTATRRAPLQRKTGAGITCERFAELAADDAIGHVGLTESADLLAAALGGSLADLEMTLKPVMAEAPLKSANDAVPAGRVAGQYQRLTATTTTGIGIELDLTMALTVEDPVDEVVLEGSPTITWRAVGGIAGDSGTVGSILQLAAVAPSLAPGLRTMLDLLPFDNSGDRLVAPIT